MKINEICNIFEGWFTTELKDEMLREVKRNVYVEKIGKMDGENEYKWRNDERQTIFVAFFDDFASIMVYDPTINSKTEVSLKYDEYDNDPKKVFTVMNNLFF